MAKIYAGNSDISCFYLQVERPSLPLVEFFICPRILATLCVKQGARGSSGRGLPVARHSAVGGWHVGCITAAER
jgi:hypothetical protein